MIVCFMCKKLFDPFDLIIHFKKKKIEGGHGMNGNDPVNCTFPDCLRILMSRDKFVQHVSTVHKINMRKRNAKDSVLDLHQNVGMSLENTSTVSMFDEVVASTSLETNSTNEPVASTAAENNTVPASGMSVSDSAAVSDATSESVEETERVSDLLVCKEIITEKIINFCALLNGMPAVTASQIELTLNHVDTLVNYVTSYFLSLTSSFFTYSSPEQAKIATATLNNSLSFINDTFENFKSHYRQLKFFEKLELYVPPKKINLGQVLKIRKKRQQFTCKFTNRKKFKSTYRHVPVQESCVLLSPRKILSIYLKQEGVLQEIVTYLNNLHADGDTLENVVQGRWWQTHVKQNDNELVIPLYIWNDEVECGNCLGSAAGGVSKINTTNMSVASLPREKRSGLHHIFVVLLTKASNRKRYGNKVLFKPLIDELNSLSSEGITVKLSGKEFKVRFKVVLLTGDNLGLNGITGFAENFSVSKFPCRICVSPINERRKMTVENPRTIRTVSQYNKDVAKKNLKLTGIKEGCVWNELDDFHVLLNSAGDQMHDFNEGVAKYDLLALLDYFINERKYFTLAILNARIESFDFGSDVSNKPAIVAKQHLKNNRLKLSASEATCFLKYFGLLIGDLVPRDDKAWKLYVLIREIADVLLTPVLPKRALPHLKKLIIQHHSLYMSLTKKNLPFKFHMFIHYIRFIEEFGPLIHYSSMRNESKNKEEKNTAKAVATRRNLCLTIAKKCQLKFCYDAFVNNFSKTVLEWGKIEHNWKHKSFLEDMKDLIPSFPLPPALQNEHILSTTWLNMNGTKYHVGDTLLFDVDTTNNSPLFGSIDKILVSSTREIYFLLRNYQTVKFDEHYFAHEVELLDSFSIRKSNELTDFHPHTVVTISSGACFISLPHFQTTYPSVST